MNSYNSLPSKSPIPKFISGQATKSSWHIQLSNHPENYRLKGLSVKIKKNFLRYLNIGQSVYIYSDRNILGKVIYIDTFDVRHDENNENYYRRLGLGINASIDMINQAYQNLGNKRADELPITGSTFDPQNSNCVRQDVLDNYNTKIQEAYDTLSNIENRRKYDSRFDNKNEEDFVIFVWFYLNYTISGGSELSVFNDIKEGDNLYLSLQIDLKDRFFCLTSDIKSEEMCIKKINY